MLRRLTTLIHLARREQRQSFQESPAASPLCDLQKRKKEKKKNRSTEGRLMRRVIGKNLGNFPTIRKIGLPTGVKITTCYPYVGHGTHYHLPSETMHRSTSVAVYLIAELQAVDQKFPGW